MAKVPSNDTDIPSREQRYRHSLQPKSAITGIPTPFRHTRSQNYGTEKTKKKVKTNAPPPILEAEVMAEEGIANVSKIVGATNVDLIKERLKTTVNNVDERKHSKQSKGSRKSNQGSVLGYDNAGFEPDSKTVTPPDEKSSRQNSTSNSVRSARSTRSTRSEASAASRTTSVQSLTVVREQYCCCSRWTPCERTLFAAISVLIFIIIILVIVIILLATANHDTKSLISRLLQ